MTLREKILYHQIHPWKLAADIGCEPMSLYFLWHHKLLAGLTTHFIPPIAASGLLIAFADLDKCKTSQLGGYLREHMTPIVEGVRFAGDLAMALGAWLRAPFLIALGLVAIVLAWCSGLVSKPASR